MPDTATTCTMDFTPPADVVRFIELLTGSAESTMHFRTFTDNKNDPNPKSNFFYLQMDNHANFELKRQQDRGRGVFVGINEYKVDSRDRATNDKDITNVRAFFVDSDGTEMPEHWHLEPTFICWRSDTNWHAYWVLVNGGDPSKFKGVQLRLADHYNTDHEVCNPSRVMRVPGYLHLKDVPVAYELIERSGVRYTVDQVMAGIAELPQEDPKPQREQRSIPLAELRSTLQFVEPTFAGQHNQWVGICKAIQDMPLDGDVSAEDRWKVIVDWCSGALWNARTGGSGVPETYKGEDHLRRVVKESKGRGEQTTYATICHYAQKNGWGTRVEEEPRVPLVQMLVRMSDYVGKSVPKRSWLIEGIVPIGVTTSYYGDAGLGKTLTAQQLQCSTALGTSWLGLPTSMKVPSLGIYCEDSDDELHRRAVDIANSMNKGLDAFNGYHHISRLGCDNALITFSPSGSAQRTPFWHELREMVMDLQVRLLIFDTASDAFFGNENDRSQVRRFVGMCFNPLAQEMDGAVVFTAHPSLSGMAKGGRGYSGSTAWNGSVRSRLLLTGSQDDGSPYRELLHRKVNYAAGGTKTAIEWKNGAFVPTEIREAKSIIKKTDGKNIAIILQILISEDPCLGGALVDESHLFERFSNSVECKQPKRAFNDSITKLLSEAKSRIERVGNSYRISSAAAEALEVKM